MIDPHDLPLLLTGARDGVLDPDRVADLLADWDAAAQPRFAQFLVDRGLLAPDALRRLEGAAGTVDQSTPRGSPTPLTPEDEVSALVAGRLDETPTHAANGHIAVAADRLPDIGSRYRLIRPHRGGGLGTVWLGYDTVLGRQVAVKVLRADRLDLPTVRQRFLIEGKATGRLEHPNIVPVYDLVEPAPGRDPAYVMRFVAGRTLAEAARAYHAAAPQGEATRAALAPLLDAVGLVCRAVAFAHSKGVLHRDLKGANIILGEFGEVNLLDWGLAKPVTAVDAPTPPPVLTDADDTDLTATGGVVGTPAYMAPEVAAGLPARPASDVYGLGATLYHVLTGRPPADGPTPQEVLIAVRSHDPPPPRKVNPKVPAGLDAIVRKAMHRDPAQRYPSADELAADLRRWQADEPVTARRDGLATRAARWGRRHRTLTVAAGLVLLTAAVGLAVADARLVREQRQTADQRDRADAARAATDALVVRLLAVAEAGLAEVPGSEPARRALLDAALDTYRPLLADRPDDPSLRWQVGKLLLHRAGADFRVGRLDAADAGHRAADDLLVPLAAEWPDEYKYRAELVIGRADHSRVLLRLGRAQEGVGLLVLPVTADGWPKAYYFHRYAEAEAARGDWAEAGRMAGMAAEQYHALRADPHTSELGHGLVLEAQALILRGDAERQHGRTAQAAASYAAAAAVLDAPLVRTGGNTPLLPGSLDVARAQCHLALTLVAPDPASHLAEAVRLADGLAAKFPADDGMTRLAVFAKLARGRRGGPTAAADLEFCRAQFERLAASSDPPAATCGLIETYLALADRDGGDWAARAADEATRAAQRWPELVAVRKLRDLTTARLTAAGR